MSILNFEEIPEGATKAPEINSPRTLEACLQCGVDPSELRARSKKKFQNANLSEIMIEKQYASFERKRRGNYLHEYLASRMLFDRMYLNIFPFAT